MTHAYQCLLVAYPVLAGVVSRVRSDHGVQHLLSRTQHRRLCHNGRSIRPDNRPPSRRSALPKSSSTIAPTIDDHGLWRFHSSNRLLLGRFLAASVGHEHVLNLLGHAVETRLVVDVAVLVEVAQHARGGDEL